jgi:predicted alpha/beta hydrolase family esterase/HD superfamily phosphohydrolase YqeK
MKKAVILHGTSATPESNWFSWLADELKKQGYAVWLPQLPDADIPNIHTYNNFLLNNTDFVIDADTILIGHSSGAVEILSLLQNLPTGSTIGDVYLVSAFTDNLGWDVLYGMFLEPYNYEVIKEKARSFTLFHSDNDPYVPLEHAQFIAEKLDATLLVKPGKGHFNVENSPKYKEFPELLEIIIASNKIEKLENAVRQLYESKNTNRSDWCDWLYAEHVFVVADYTVQLAIRYDAPIHMSKAAALLHDIADVVMSRFSDEHEQQSLEIARNLLADAGYTTNEIEIIVDDAIAFHSCHNGIKPHTDVGKVLATADALAHLKTNFYMHATEHMMNDMPKDKRRDWAVKKIPRDYNDKIMFDEVRDEVKPYYEKLTVYFGITI